MTRLAVVALAAFFTGILAPAVPAAASPAPRPLVGTFSIGPGRCNPSGPPSGSYLQVELNGLPVPNPGSACGLLGGQWTPLQPGDRGLVTGAYQPDPVPAFDGSGNSLAADIIHPVRFLTADLGLATTCTGGCTAPPSLSAEGPGVHGCPKSSPTDCVFGDLSSLGLRWAGLDFGRGGGGTCAGSYGCYDQGVSRGPDLTRTACTARKAPQTSCSLQGAFTPSTGAYTLDLRAAIPTGILQGTVVHYVLTGTFSPSPNPGRPSAPPASGGTGPAAGPGSDGTPRTAPDPTSSGRPSAPALAPALASLGQPSPAGSGLQQLVGAFSLVQPSCSASQPAGSYFVVAYGDKAARNSSSSCVGGSYTLLPPGATGLPTGQFADVPTPTFDAAGDSLANSIVAPVPFNGHKLGMGTSPNDVQDAPQGPPTYAAPMALIEGRTLLVDLRPLFVTYNGRPGATCLTGWGVGCWEEGSKAAMGTYDPVSHRFTLDWRASQAFTGASAGISFHLEGSFAGQITAAPADAGADWRPDQYVLTGSSTQAGDVGGTGPAGGAGGLAVAPSSSDPQVGAAPTSASPLPSWLAAGHSSRRVAVLSAVSGILVLLISAATVIIAGRRVPRS